MFIGIIGCILSLQGLYLLWIALLGQNPKNQSSTIGTLAKTITRKNVPLKYGGNIKIQTDYTYTYTVNGKLYHCRGQKNSHSRTLPKKVTIIYLTHHPRYGNIERFSGSIVWSYAICCLLFGAMMLMLSVLIQI